MNNRYSRHTMLSEIGCEGQKRLSQARVLIVGVGGLGSAISIYLTAAGIGHIGIIDNDVVSESNMQRQILYSENEIGRSKTQCAYNRMKLLSQRTHIDTYPTRLDSHNAADIISQYDMVVDGCDNAVTRYIIDDICAQQGKPYIYGAIDAYSGQVSVFDARQRWRYIDLYPDIDCAIAQQQHIEGVVSTLPGIIGTIQATEVIKLITGMGDCLIKKVFTIDTRTMKSNIYYYE